MTQDLALLILRLLLGGFFLLYRFRFVYDPAQVRPWFHWSRRKRLQDVCRACGYTGVLSTPVAVGELAFAFSVLVGFASNLSALGLATITLAATLCTAREKTMRQEPEDALAVASSYLWNVEPWIIAVALALALMGPGQWSMDAWLFGA